MALLTLEAVHDLTRRVLEENGLSTVQSEAVARIVTRAEADECRSHGLYRVPGYVTALRSGRVNGTAQPWLQRLAPGLLRADGDGGFAPGAAQFAHAAFVEATRANGIAALALGNCHHFSALWADVEPLVAEGLVVWAFVVGQCSVAPSGGTERLMGTNPIGFGWPRPGAPPFIFDFATSAAARGEVELKRLAGETLPEGWALDSEGHPTTDPADALAGSLLPFGGHKGSALSMMVELIAGPLIGEKTSRQVAELGIHDGGPPPGGELFIAIAPERVSANALSMAESFFADARRQPSLRLPSDRRHDARKRTRDLAVTVPDELLRSIRALRRVGPGHPST